MKFFQLIRDSETIHYTFLFQCKVIEEQASQVIIQRAPEDIELIEQQDQLVTKLQEDMNYIKQELIEARSHKAASDDELGNVKGQMETLQNNITSLSEEGKLISHCSAVRRGVKLLNYHNFN